MSQVDTRPVWYLVSSLLQSASPSAGAAQVPVKKKGAGTKMLDDMRKKGKPVTPKLEEMALWLDGLDTSTLDDGQVSFCQHLHAMQSMAWCHLLNALSLLCSVVSSPC